MPLKFFDFHEFNTKYSQENERNIQNLRRGFLARRPRYFIYNNVLTSKNAKTNTRCDYLADIGRFRFFENFDPQIKILKFSKIQI